MFISHFHKAEFIITDKSKEMKRIEGKCFEGIKFNDFKYFSSIISLICGQDILLFSFLPLPQTNSFGLSCHQNLFPSTL
jgi:hypothetical protein